MRWRKLFFNAGRLVRGSHAQLEGVATRLEWPNCDFGGQFWRAWLQQPHGTLWIQALHLAERIGLIAVEDGRKAEIVCHRVRHFLSFGRPEYVSA